MLRPTKHMNPDRSALALAAVLLVRLKRTRIQGYSALVEYACKEMPDGDTLFSAAIALIFVLGLVEYKSNSDTFEYVGP